MDTFPYFRSAETRNAMLAGMPSPVTSCWNGVLLVDAEPYYDQAIPDTEQKSHYRHSGLRFRGLPDSLALHHLEASECCLIHADLIASGHAHKGIFVHPAVRTGYDTKAYNLTHQGPEKGFVDRKSYVLGIWRNRFARWKRNGLSDRAISLVKGRIRDWQTEVTQTSEKRTEVGDYCTVYEMHILIFNGWKHIWEQ